MRLTRILIALSLALAWPAAADERDDWYDIEVIVFEHKAGPGTAAEAWSLDPGAPAIELAVEAAPVAEPFPGPFPEPFTDLLAAPAGEQSEPLPPAEPDSPYRQLEPVELKLERLYNRLTVSTEYEALLHFGWRQPANPDRPAQGVRVHSPLETIPAPPPSTLFIDTTATRAPAPRAKTIDGVISLQRSRFLHLNVDLLLSEPAAASVEAGLFSIFSRRESRPASWRLQAQRRIRVNEVHYFDHPVFGVLIQVTPHTPPSVPAD